MLGNSDSEIGSLAAIGPFGAPPSSKYDRLIARAKRCRPRPPSSLIPAKRRRCAGRSKRPKPASSCRSWSGRPRRFPAWRASTVSISAVSRSSTCRDSEAAAAKAVELIREGKGELLMKGSLHTDELMREVSVGQNRPAHGAADQPRLHHGRARPMPRPCSSPMRRSTFSRISTPSATSFKTPSICSPRSGLARRGSRSSPRSKP